MLIHGISIQNFRSIRSQTFHFDHDLTYIVGKNTVGKTNILEAIALLSTGKSFRNVSDREMITWDEEYGRVKGKLEDDDLEILLTIGMVQNVKYPAKKYLINGVSRRSVDAVGMLKTIVFAPEDVDLVTGSPSLRRNFLDTILSQANRNYRRELATYEKGIRQRNKLLFMIHEGMAQRDQLQYWNELIIHSGQYLTQSRQQLLDFCFTVKVPGKQFLAFYDKSEISEQRLAQYTNEEVAAKVTLVGPHRDNFIIKIKKKEEKLTMENNGLIESKEYKEYVDVSIYGSRGEQRLSVLWLKLAALAYVVETTGDKPVLLLDDIFSELDSDHQQVVMGIIHDYQTVITSADPYAVDQMRKLEPGVLIEL